MAQDNSTVRVSVSESSIPGMWAVEVSVADGRFRPTAGADWAMSRTGRILFTGSDALSDAHEAAEQLSFALKPLSQVIPLDDVDSLLARIARQVGAHQLANGDGGKFDYGGVVRSYIRDGAWKTMHQRTAIAEEKAAKLDADNRALRAEIEFLKRQALKTAIQIVSTERIVWKEPGGNVAEGDAGVRACENILAQLRQAAKAEH